MIVWNDMGGVVVDRMVEVQRMWDQNEEVRIRGYCISACTLYLWLPKELLCVYPGVKFQFHAPRRDYGKGPIDQAAVDAMMRFYPPWVQKFINAHGGLQDRLLPMPEELANRYLRRCDDAS